MSPTDCILMMCVQLAETTDERDRARQRVLELETQAAQAEAAPGNGAGDVHDLQTVEARG